MHLRWPHRLLVYVLSAFATLQFVRFYVVSTRFYLKMPAYLSGHERLPFQERVLPILLMWPINHSALILRAVAHRGLDPETASAATPTTVAFYLVSLVSFVIAGLYVRQLYKVVTVTASLGSLVYPVFLIVCLWTYVIHIDADYSYPYDFPSLAFFTAGIYYIYMRRFTPLFLIVAIGTFNRETTFFLIGIYFLDSASTRISDPASLYERFSLRNIRWLRVASLAITWLAIKFFLAHEFSHNNASESYNRFIENVYRLKPRLLPSLLNICGYILPVLWVLRRRLRPTRFANYIYILPFWIGIMFFTGVILETRIYGELCSFAAVAVVLLLEQHVQALSHRRPSPEIEASSQIHKHKEAPVLESQAA